MFALGHAGNNLVLEAQTSPLQVKYDPSEGMLAKDQRGGRGTWFWSRCVSARPDLVWRKGEKEKLKRGTEFMPRQVVQREGANVMSTQCLAVGKERALSQQDTCPRRYESAGNQNRLRGCKSIRGMLYLAMLKQGKTCPTPDNADQGSTAESFSILFPSGRRFRCLFKSYATEKATHQ